MYVGYRSKKKNMLLADKFAFHWWNNFFYLFTGLINIQNKFALISNLNIHFEKVPIYNHECSIIVNSYPHESRVTSGAGHKYECFWYRGSERQARGEAQSLEHVRANCAVAPD